MKTTYTVIVQHRQLMVKTQVKANSKADAKILAIAQAADAIDPHKTIWPPIAPHLRVTEIKNNS